jgi:hypothetical protein
VFLHNSIFIGCKDIVANPLVGSDYHYHYCWVLFLIHLYLPFQRSIFLFLFFLLLCVYHRLLSGRGMLLTCFTHPIIFKPVHLTIEYSCFYSLLKTQLTLILKCCFNLFVLMGHPFLFC